MLKKVLLALVVIVIAASGCAFRGPVRHGSVKPVQPALVSLKAVIDSTPTPLPSVTNTHLPSATPTSAGFHFSGQDWTIPVNFDELYYTFEGGDLVRMVDGKVVTIHYDKYIVEDCRPSVVPGSEDTIITWSMVQEMYKYLVDDGGQKMIILPVDKIAKIVYAGGGEFPSGGTLRISEDEVYTVLVSLLFTSNPKNKGKLFIKGLCSPNHDGSLYFWGRGGDYLLGYLAAHVVNPEYGGVTTGVVNGMGILMLNPTPATQP